MQFNDKLGTVRNRHGGPACPTSNRLHALNFSSRSAFHFTERPPTRLACRLQIHSYQALVKAYQVTFNDGSSQFIPKANLQEVCICRVATSSGRI